jgi:predicted deacylase
MTTVGSATAEAGEIATGRLRVGETRDGSPVGLPVCVIEGAETGETLYVQAASDGDELNGVGVVQRFVPRVDPAEVTGRILIVGIVNYHGFQTASHRNPIDDTKLNRVYPGDPEGTSSERIAHATFEIAAEADLAVDLHQGSTSRMIDEVRIRCSANHRLHEECLELAKVFDCGYILDQKGPEGQLARAAPDEGVPTIDPELGGAVGWDERSIETGVRGLLNVLGHYGFIDHHADPEPQVRAQGFERYASPVGGLVRFRVDLGDRVERGDTLFEVTDVFGAAKTAVSADVGGVFWRTPRLPLVATA